jgi:predicted DNA-binding transcriptional regulator YafY
MSHNVIGTRVVDPYVLCLVSSRWYLLAHDHRRGRVLKFAIDRIWSVKETGKAFRRPAGFSAAQHLKHAFGIYEAPDEQGTEPGEIRIRFDAFAARYVRETKWHDSQKLTLRSDGGVELTIVVRGSVEVERFVLGWGEHAEVLAPADLRDCMRRRIAGALSAYEVGQ